MMRPLSQRVLRLLRVSVGFKALSASGETEDNRRTRRSSSPRAGGRATPQDFHSAPAVRARPGGGALHRAFVLGLPKPIIESSQCAARLRGRSGR